MKMVSINLFGLLFFVYFVSVFLFTFHIFLSQVDCITLYGSISKIRVVNTVNPVNTIWHQKHFKIFWMKTKLSSKCLSKISRLINTSHHSLMCTMCTIYLCLKIFIRCDNQFPTILRTQSIIYLRHINIIHKRS